LGEVVIAMNRLISNEITMKLGRQPCFLLNNGLLLIKMRILLWLIFVIVVVTKYYYVINDPM
jgi:hypothetical protein